MNLTRSLFCTAILLSSPLLAPAGDWGGKDGGKAVTYPAASTWSVEANAVFMKRNSPDPQVYITQPNGNPAFDFSQFEFDYDAGFDISISREFGSGNALEFRYFNLSDTSANATTGPFPGGGVQYISNPQTPAFFPGTATFVDGSFQSEIQSAEVNYICSKSENLEVGIGFRYLSLDESFIGALDFNTPNDGFARSTTTNDLFGIQLSGKGALYSSPNSKFQILGSAKGGIFYADSTNTQGISFTNTFGSASDSGAAFVGEAGIKVQYSVQENVDVFAGYQLLFFEGVAVASEQIAVSGNIFNSNNTARVTNDGSALFHGFIVGAGIKF